MELKWSDPNVGIRWFLATGDTSFMPKPPQKTLEEKVIELVKGKFKADHGIEPEEFVTEYTRLRIRFPEKLI